MTALLSPAIGGSMQSQMEAKLASMNLKSPGLKSNMPSSPSARNFSSTANPNRQSLAFDSTPSSFLSPDTSNALGNPSDAAATLAQQRAKLKASNAAHRISAPAFASSTGERGPWAGASPLGQVAERDGSPTQEITIEPKSSRPQSTDFSGIAAGAPFRSPRPEGTGGSNTFDTLSPAMGDSWASMVNTPQLTLFPKTSTANNSGTGPTQTVDLATAKLNDLYGAGTVPRLDGPEKFRRASKGHVSDVGSSGNTSTAVASGTSNNGIYGDDGDLIQAGQQVGRQGGSARSLRNGNGSAWSGAHSPALSNNSGRFGGSDDGSSAMAAAAQQQAALAGLGMGVGGFNIGLGSPGLAGMQNGLSMAQLAQLNGMNGINPFGVNMNMLGMANLNAMGLTAEAQLLAAQIAAGGFGQPGLASLGNFGGLQGGMGGAGQRNGPGRSGGRSPGAGSNKGSSSSGAKKDEDDFDPAVLNDVAGWLRTLRLHKYTPNFEGMTWKDMVVMDEAALEAQGVAALGARRKMLKTFELVRKKMGIDDPTAPPPPGIPAPTPVVSSLTTGSGMGPLGA
jgi:SAM domain (Sterile alpha motif)